MMTTTNHSFALDGDDAARELREITRIGAIRGSAGDDSNSTHAPGTLARMLDTAPLPLHLGGEPDDIR